MNDENFTPSVGELSQDQWWLLLWSLITDIPEKEWKEFTHDLIYKDRLFDDKKCKAFRSDMIKVGNIELKFENPEIYQLEELMKNDEGVNQ